MNSYETACRELASSIEGSLLCGVIEVHSGKVLALHGSHAALTALEPEFSRSSLELLRGPNTTLFGTAAQNNPAPQSNTAQASATPAAYSEMHWITSQTCHFAKVLADGQHALVLVTRKDINVGMGWAELKVAVTALDRLAATA